MLSPSKHNSLSPSRNVLNSNSFKMYQLSKLNLENEIIDILKYNYFSKLSPDLLGLICLFLDCNFIYSNISLLSSSWTMLLIKKGILKSSNNVININNISPHKRDKLIYYSSSINICNKYSTVLSYLNCYYNFHHVKKVICKNNNLHSLPKFPSSLIYLDCSNNEISNLCYYPNLKHLNCSKNKLDSLPELSASLIHLDCSYNNLIDIPELPLNLISLLCSSNKIIKLPVLPNKLQILKCSSNNLLELPELPLSMKILLCHENPSLSIPELPKTIQYINFDL